MKKGQKKMSKISTEDLDFDDIAGKTSEPTTPPKVTLSSEETQPKEVKSSENDYALAIRLSADTLQLITLETCTSAEFFQCMSQMYPYMGESDPDEIFATRQARIRTLKHVLNFHQELNKHLRNVGKLSKKENKPAIN